MIAISPAEAITGIGAATGLGLAAGAFTYASRWPSSQLFGASLIAPRHPGELALTFDDGPNPVWTPPLLDLLAAHGVKATFFLLGSRAAAEPFLVRHLAEQGHTVGNHSWNHPNLALASAHRVWEELDQTRLALEEMTGRAVRFFRPPFGARRPVVLKIARELGMRPVLWNAMTSDWREPSGEKIAARLAARIDRLQRRGHAANIVLHDGGHREKAANREPSISAVERLILRYKATHTFVPLDAWV